VAAAAKGVEPVYLDCKDPVHKAIVKKWKAYDLPMLGFTTWEGAKIEEYEGPKDVESLVARLGLIAEKHRRDLPWAEDWPKALEKAKKDGKLVAVSYAEKPEHEAVLREPALWPLVRDFVWVRATKDSDEAKRLAPAGSPTIVVFEGEKELLRLGPRTDAKELEKALAAFHESRKK
jgi:hypothetical protein